MATEKIFSITEREIPNVKACFNDNDGNTLFPLHNLNIQPVSGRVIVFPPTWEYPHTGLAPKIDSKYIMSTYIHYGEN